MDQPPVELYMSWIVVEIYRNPVPSQTAHATYLVNIQEIAVPVNSLIDIRYRRFFRTDKTTLAEVDPGHHAEG